MERTLSTEEKRVTMGMWEGFCQKILLNQLKKLAYGQIVLTFADTTVMYGEVGRRSPVRVHLKVLNPAFFPKVVFGGTIGAGESYMDGDWKTDNLTDLVRIMVRNREVLEGLDGGFSMIKKPVLATVHALNSNTRAGAARNIAAHYDLGNDFFEKFLDATMMYSCAWFPDSRCDLLEASVAKMDRICRKLDLKPGDRVIEIGSGWGAFALHAARNYGCHVTTTTISQNQYDKTVQLIASAGLSAKVQVLKQDYRDLEGTYNKLVSIEMIEAVGSRFLGGYLQKCSRLLTADGIGLIQAITINDWLYDEAVNSVDFIKRYIFPGSFIPSISAITDAMKHHTDLRLFHLEDITSHYVQTLQRWRENFNRNRADIQKMGFDDAFLRMWEFYFCYCEGGFEERSIGCAQLVFTRQQNRLVHLNY